MAKKPTEKQLFNMKNKFLQDRFEKVTPKDFYRDLFPEGYMEDRGDLQGGKPNAIYTIIHPGDDGKKKYAKNTIMFNDLQELDAVLGAEFAVTSPLTYCGRNRTAANAHHLWGFAVDLDGVEMQQLQDLLFQIQNKVLPEPTYLVNSGHGIHVYFLFEEPIPMYTWLHKPLTDLKHGLTDVIWNRYTSAIDPDKKQFQGIFQGFRMPGTQSKLGKRYPVTAFKTGNKHMLAYLNEFVDEKYRFKGFDELNHLTLDEARVKYPDWYERRIVKGKKRGKWLCHRGLYEWWKKQIRAGAFDGNRYNCIAVLMTYAVKCGVDREEVLNDALELLPWMNSLTTKAGNEFTEQDIYDAFTYFGDSYVTYSIKAIEARTQITIKRNLRKGRKQSEHVKLMNYVREELNGNKDWRNKNGRPKGSGTKEQLVKDYIQEHPDQNVTQIARELGISRPTVYKYLQTTMIEPEYKTLPDGQDVLEGQMKFK